MASDSKTGKGVHKGLKRPKPSPLALEPRFVFDAAAGAELVHRFIDPGVQAAMERNVAAAEAASRQVELAETAITIQPIGERESVTDDAAPPPARDHRVDRQPLEQEHAWRETVQAIADRPATEGTTLYVVDSRVPDLQSVTDGLPEGAYLILDPVRDGVEQVSEFLAGRTGVSTLVFITDGAPGQIQLGATTFDAASLQANAGEVATWSSALTDGGDILLLGCDVNADGAGQAFLQRLADLTGADVAASTDPTGAVDLGGDLVLETRIGEIEADSLSVIDDVLGDFQDVLAVSGVSVVTPAPGGDNAIGRAEISGGFTVQAAANNAQTNGKDLLLIVRDGANVIYWQVFSANVTNGSTPTNYDLAVTTTDAFGSYSPGSGNLTFEVRQGTGSASTSGRYSGSYFTNAPTGGGFTTAGFTTVIGYSANTAATIGDPTDASVTEGESPTTLTAAGTISVNDPDPGQAAFNTTVTPADGNLGSLTLAANGTYTYSVANSAVQHLHAGQTKVDSFTVTSTDGTSKVISFTINGAGSPPVNEAPVLDATKSPVLEGVAQTAGAPSGAVGTTVSSLLTDAYSDAEGAAGGVAITGLNGANGTWWYSTNNGSTWTAVGSVSEAEALLLGSTARLYFQPNGTFAGTMTGAVTFRAWDGEGGSEAQKVSVASNGGSTGFSADSDTAALTVRPAYSLTSPDSAFSRLLVGNRFDPAEDTQANSSDLDLYGEGGTPLLYGAYDANSEDLYYRVRIDNPTLSKGVPVFTSVLLMGVDIDGDGALDIFVGVDNRNNGMGVVTYAPGGDLNISPSTTSITGQQSVAGGSTAAKSGYINYSLAGADLGGDGKQDALLTFRVPFEVLAQRVLELTGKTITPGSSLGFVLLTLTQNNSINGDIGGVGKLTNAQKDITWNDLGILNPISFTNPELSNISGGVTFTENGSAVRLAPSASFIDMDAAGYAGGQLSVSLTGAAAGDQVTLASVGGITTSGANVLYNGQVIGTYASSAGGLTVSFSGDYATNEAVTAAMQAAAYSNTSDAPTTGARSAGFTLTDPEGHASVSRNVAVFVTPVNDAPTVGGVPAAHAVINGMTYDVADAAAPDALLLGPGVSSGVAIADVDAAGGQVRVTLSTAIGVIEAYDGSSLVSSTGSTTIGGVTLVGSGTGAVTLTGTVADINGFLAGSTTAKLIFQPGNGADNGQVVTIGMSVSDLGNTGQGGVLTGSGTFAQVTVLDEPAVIGDFAGAAIEDTGVVGGDLVVTGELTTTLGAMSSPAVTFQGNSAGSASALGSLQLVGTTWTYTVGNSAAAVQALGPGETLNETFEVQATVNGVLTTAYVQVTVTGVNDAPTVTATALTPTFTEGGAPVDLFSSAAISTVESFQNIDSLTLQVTGVELSEAEFIRIDGVMVALSDLNAVTTASGFAVSVATVGATATITITAPAGMTTAQAQALMNGLGYDHGAQILTATSRTITVAGARDTGGDAGAGDDTAALSLSTIVNLEPVNDGPSLATAPASIGEGRVLPLSDAYILAADSDTAPEQLVYTLAQAPAHGALEYNDGSGWREVPVGAPSFTQAQVNAGMVRYTADVGTSNGTAETLDLTVSDGEFASAQPFVITIVNTNQAPVVYDSIATTPEDTPYVFTLADFQRNDPDTSDTVSWVKIQAPPAAGTLQVRVDGVWTAVTGLLQVDADAITAGDLRFTPAGDANGTAYATFEFTLADGQGAESLETAVMNVNVTPVNDAPALGSVTGVTLTETAANDAPAAATGTLSASDVDAGDTKTYGIGGTGVSTGLSVEMDGVTYDQSRTGSYGTLYLESTTGKYRFEPNATALNAVAAGQTPSESFTFTVTDSGGLSDSESLTVSVTGANDTVAITDATNPSAVTEAVDASAQDIGALSGTLTVSDRDVGDTLTASVTGDATALLNGDTPPAGVDVSSLIASGAISFGSATSNGGSRAISWTYDPAAADLDWLAAGDVLTITYTAQVSDGAGNVDAQPLVITINGVNDAPVLAAPLANQSVESGSVLSYQFPSGAFTDVDSASLTYTATLADGSALPAWLQFNAATRTFSGTPGDEDIDVLAVKVTASDGSLSASDEFTLTVTAAPAAPAIGGDIDGAVVEASGSANAVEGTPTASGVLTVSDPDADQTFVAQTVTSDYGTFTLATDGGWTYELDNTFEATEALTPGDEVTETFTVANGDGLTATVTITITGGNDAPLLAPVAAITLTDTAASDTPAAKTGTLVAREADAGDTKTYDIGGAGVSTGLSVELDGVTYDQSRTGSYGTLYLESTTGKYRFEPNATALNAVAAGQTPSESFTFTVTDSGGLSDSESLTVSVTGANDTPTISAVNAGTITDTAADDTYSALSGSIAASDRDGTLSYGMQGGTDNGTTVTLEGTYGTLVVTKATGAWTYTPKDSAIEGLKTGQSDSFTITASDDTASVSNTLSVTLTGANDTPVLTADVTTATLTDTAANDAFADIDGDLSTADRDASEALTYSVSGQAADVSLTGFTHSVRSTYGKLYLNTATGAYRFVADAAAINALGAGATQTPSFTFTVTDGSGATDTETLSLTITGANDTPAISAVNAGTITDTAADDAYDALSGTIAASDRDGVLSYGVQGGTDNGTTVTLEGTYGTLVVTKATGAWIYTPKDSAIEGLKTGQSDSFTITASDGTAAVDSTLSVTLTGANDKPVLTADVTTATLTDTAANDTFADIDGDLSTADRDVSETLTYSVSGQAADVSLTGFTHSVRSTYGKLYLNTATGAYRFVADAAAINALGAGAAQTPSFTFTVIDGSGATDTETLALTINGANDTAVASGPNTGAVAEDGTLTAGGALVAADRDAGQSLFQAPASLAGQYGAFTFDETTGAWGYSLSNASAGVQALAAGETVTDTLTVKSTDGTASRTITVTVTGANDAPAAVADTVSTDENTPVTFDVRTNDTDVEGEGLGVVEIDGQAIATGESVAVDGGEVTLNADGALTFTPTAAYNGSPSFTYAIADAQGVKATATVNLSVGAVNDAPTAADDEVALDEDATATFDVRANDDDLDGDALTVTEIDGEPVVAGAPVTVDHGEVVLNADGTLTFTPDDNANGVFSFEYTVADGNGGTASATVTLTAGAMNDAPVAGDDNATVSEDGQVVLDVLANDTDLDGDSLAVTHIAGQAIDVDTSVTLADGVVSLGSDGKLTFTPAANFNGDVSFDYTLSDGQGGSATATVDVTVAPVNDAPVATNDTVTTSEDTPVTFDVRGNDSDVEGGSLTVTHVAGQAIAVGAPVAVTGGSISLGSDGKLTFTPVANYNGSQTFSYTVSDGHGGAATASVSLTVSSVNDAPTAANDAVTTSEDTPVTFDVRTNDGDLDGNALVVTHVAGQPVAAGGSVTVTGGVVTLGADGRLTFTPAANYNGASTFSYAISDGQGGTAAAAVTVNVSAVNDAPVAAADVVTTTEDAPVIFDPRTNDGDVDGDSLTVTHIGGQAISVGSPVAVTGGSVSLGADGKLTFTPDADYSGSQTFSYTVSDSHGAAATASISLTVTAANDAPNAENDAATVAEDGQVVIDVLANDTDLDGDDLVVTHVEGQAIAVGSPVVLASGVVSLNADGTLTFAPAENFNGDVSFGYTVRDPSGASVTARVDVAVTGVNDAPTAANDTVATSEDTAVTFDVRTNDGDVDGDSLTVTHVAGQPISAGSPVTVTGGSVVLNADGTLTFTPTADFNGAPTFTYMVSDGHGGASTASITLNVAPVNDAPTSVSVTPPGGSGPLSVPENAAGAIIGSVGVTDADAGDSHTYTVSDDRFEVVGGVLKLKDGVSLDYETEPQVTVSVTARDAAGVAVAQPFVIAVTDVNEASTAAADAYAMDQGGALTIAAGAGVLVNDTDPEGAQLAAQVVNGPANGVLTLNADGSLTYTPNGGFSGVDTFTYRAQDGSGAPGQATVTITVRAVAPPPVEPPPPPPPPPPPAPVIADPAPEPAPEPTQVFQLPASVSSAGIGFIDDVSLLATTSLSSSFTGPEGYQMMVLPSSNDALVLFRGVPDQEFDTSSTVRFWVPVDAFAHTRSDETVTLIATQMDGSPLPGWLTFSGQRGLFEGVPPKDANGELVIKVIARDREGREAAAVFRVKLSPAGATEAGTDKMVKDKFALKKVQPATLAESKVAADLRVKAAKLAARL